MQNLITLILQTPRSSLSKAVIIGAAIFLILGVAAVVYFFRRVKNTEQEAEEDWDAAGRKLFSVEPPVVKSATEESVSESVSSGNAVSSPFPEQIPEPTQQQEHFAAAPFEVRPEPASRVTNGQAPIESAGLVAEQPAAQPLPKSEARDKPAIRVEPHDLAADSSPAAEPASTLAAPTENVGSPFGDEIWSQLDQADAAEAPLPGMVRADDDEVEAPLAGMVRGAEVRQRSAHAPFSPAPPEHPDSAVVAAGVSTSASPVKAGSILGLPAEPSDKPIVLGQPSRQSSIGTLSNYGKPADDEGGRGGTITLAVVVIIIGGAVASYFLSPKLHSAVNDWVARTRGSGALSESEPVKAQIFPSRPELTKDQPQAVARGTVINISSEELAGLSVEVALTRKDGGAPDSRGIPVIPDKLPAGQQGVYEFDLDPGQYAGYQVVKLRNNEGKVIKVATPSQQK